MAHVLVRVSPCGTLVVNVVGSLLMGLSVEGAAPRRQFAAKIKALLMTGLLANFIIFWIFSLDVMPLIQRDQFLLTGAYFLTYAAFIISALFMGVLIIRWCLS